MIAGPRKPSAPADVRPGLKLGVAEFAHVSIRAPSDVGTIPLSPLTQKTSPSVGAGGVVQPPVFSAHEAVQESVPPMKPWPMLMQVWPPRSAPSQGSVPSRTPLPQVVQPDVT